MRKGIIVLVGLMVCLVGCVTSKANKVDVSKGTDINNVTVASNGVDGYDVAVTNVVVGEIKKSKTFNVRKAVVGVAGLLVLGAIGVTVYALRRKSNKR